MKGKRAGLITLATAAIALAGIYVGGALYYQHARTFFSGTQVAGVSLGGQTVDSATHQLETVMQHQVLTLKDGQQTLMKVNPQQAGIKVQTKAALTRLLDRQNVWQWPLHRLTAQADTTTLPVDKREAAKLKALATTITTKANATGKTATHNAGFSGQQGQFVVTKEVYGTELSATKVTQQIEIALGRGQRTVQLDTARKTPTITTKSQAFKTALARAKTLATKRYQYHLTTHTMTVPAKTITDWLTYKNGQLTTKQAAITTYLATLNHRYATQNKPHAFKTHGGSHIKIPAGLYGWTINQTAEAAAVTPLILKGHGFTRTPRISGTGYHASGTDIGRSYVEVDKASQHMWVYRNGKVVVSTDVVTGLPHHDHSTPSGAWVIWSKQRHATLRGLNDNGTKYASPVNYWMPVDQTGVGIHDSPWQPRYGGNWYLTHGSHGCVNTPPSEIGQVWANVSVGTPVIIY